MDADERQAEQFEEHRAHLRAVAYRMLGSLSEADDAVQEAWLRLSRDRFDRLAAFKARRALATWDDTVDVLLQDPRGQTP